MVANGCTDDTEAIARRAGARLISLPQPCGHDVGRALGARVARGRYILFLDADIVWSPEELQPFVLALHNGADVALNHYPRRQGGWFHHPTAVAKRTLNLLLHRPDLGAASFTTVPHAITARALNAIGWEHLAVPPVAHARAILAGLRVRAAHHINVSSRNPRQGRHPRRTKALILGDHLQAIAYLIAQRGVRGGFPDGDRRRDLIPAMKDGHERASGEDDGAARMASPAMSIAIVIPAHNESQTVADVVHAARNAGAECVCVIENGSRDATAAAAAAAGAQVECYPQRVGHDVGRAIGVTHVADAACAIFLDADFAIHPRDIHAFGDAIANGADVALNRLESYLPLSRQTDPVSTVKRMLNLALGQKHLGIASLTAIPHALSQRALREIPQSDLAVPPRAMVTAVLRGLTITAPHAVDVVQPNRYRARIHSPRFGAPLAQMILGDHVEALAVLFEHRGERAGFPQTRDLGVLQSTAAQCVAEPQRRMRRQGQRWRNVRRQVSTMRRQSR